jgi:enoyl-CoA hydratase/carnithine racemase
MTDDLVSLKVDIADRVAEVTLLGPGKGNAMGPDFWRELPVVFGRLDADPDVHAVIVTGSGANFSYGLDLPAMMSTWDAMLNSGLAGPRTRFLDEVRALQQAVTSVATCRKPVIAAVSGWCVGGGVDLVAAADIRYASADAKFSIREVKVAIVADLGSLQRLAGIIGEGQLRELAYTGRNVDASYAREIGLVSGVHPDQATLLAGARELAREIAANPPLVVQGVKDVLNHRREQEVADGLRYVAAWNSAFLPSEDLREAVTAFLERRQPEFRGE